MKRVLNNQLLKSPKSGLKKEISEMVGGLGILISRHNPAILPRAFTLIELLVAIAVIAIIAIIAIIAFLLTIILTTLRNNMKEVFLS